MTDAGQFLIGILAAGSVNDCLCTFAMSPETIISVFVLLYAAGVVALFGVLIKCYGRTDLIAGYDPDKIADEEGVADVIGTNALYVAGLTALLAAVELIQPFEGYRSLWIVYLIVTAVLTIRLVRGARKYEASE